MWMMLKYKQLTPAIITHFAPFDGVLSYAYASYSGFCLKGNDDRYKAEYGYIDLLPIKKTYYNNKYFYNISVPLFSNPSVRYTTIFRKFVYDEFIHKNKSKKDFYSKSFTEKDTWKGREKRIMDKYRTVMSDYVYVIVEAEDERKLIEIADRVKFIGKKANSGYGQVSLVDYYDVEVKDFVYRDILIRPVPVSLIQDKDYLLINTRINPPYYIRDVSHEDICYIDKKIVNFEKLDLDLEVREDDKDS